MGIVTLQIRHKVSFNMFTERWDLALIQSIISRKPSFVQLLFDEGIISCLDDVEITEITEIFIHGSHGEHGFYCRTESYNISLKCTTVLMSLICTCVIC